MIAFDDSDRRYIRACEIDPGLSSDIVKIKRDIDLCLDADRNHSTSLLGRGAGGCVQLETNLLACIK
jgi:hypothetical protein